MTTRREFLVRTAAAGLLAAAPVQLEVSRRPAPRDDRRGRRGPGTVNTVRGPIDVSKLGFTLPHEHIVATSAGFFRVWPEFFGGRTTFVRKVVDRLKEAKDEGVDTIVDVPPADVGRDIRLIEELSRKSGMQIVVCTGHWLHPSLSMAARTVEELTDFFVLEIERGIEGSDIKPGVIKVATDRDGVTPFLDRALRAAARASKATGIPVTTHTLAADRGGEKQAAIFEQEGLDPAQVCLGHSDETDDLRYLTGLATRGYTIGMDHLTVGTRAVPGAEPKVLSWQERAGSVKQLIDAGFAGKLFLSNDWFFGVSIAATGAQETVERFNPDGILFSTRKAIPYLKHLGVTDDQIRTITVENPRRFFGGG
jgi:phosphotriesterase-related protein